MPLAILSYPKYSKKMCWIFSRFVDVEKFNTKKNKSKSILGWSIDHLEINFHAKRVSYWFHEWADFHVFSIFRENYASKLKTTKASIVGIGIIYKLA